MEREIIKLFKELDTELNKADDKEMGESGLYEDVILPLRELGKKMSVDYSTHFMILGLKDFPVNPNDFIPNYTEADNPYIFPTVESAQKFVDTCLENNKSGDPLYHRIVEVISSLTH